MHGQINPVVGHRLLNFFGEEALAANLRQQPVLHPVAGGGDLHDLQRAIIGQLRPRLAQQRFHMPRLPKRQGTAARADTERAAEVR